MAEVNPKTVKKIFFAIAIAIIAFLITYSAATLLTRKKVDILVESIPKGASFELGGESYQTPAKVTGVRVGRLTLELDKEGYSKRKGEAVVTTDGDNEFLFRLYTKDTAPSNILFDSKDVNAEVSPIRDFVAKLPYNASKFVIKFGSLNGEARFMVTLNPTVNSKKEPKKYKERLKKFKKEALEWIKRQNIDVDKLNIFWHPPEAVDL